MSKPETIKIDDIEYVRKDAQPKSDVRIAVLDRGFVYIGRMPADFDLYVEPPTTLTLTNAWNIRRWGTKEGLGQLVNGPLKETVLDKIGTIHVPWKSVIHLIDVVESKWPGI